MNFLKKICLIVPLIPKLGYWNFFYALWYKLSLKLGLRKHLFPQRDGPSGVFFTKCNHATDDVVNYWKEGIIKKGDEIYHGIFTLFSYHKFNFGEIPDWFFNPFENRSFSKSTEHWNDIKDFGEGDIKIVWELSRFDWVTDLTRIYKVTGESGYLNRLNDLLNNWSSGNPVNTGPNWKCGQECSFRIMKLLTAAFCLDQYFSPCSSLIEMVKQHVLRIYPNINYSVSQNNNHSVSEAAGLFIGAAWLIKNGYDQKPYRKYKELGRKVLETSILKLIEKQGTFSQRSVIYHRLVMDTVSFVLHNMKLLEENPFSDTITERLKKLGEWQFKMTFGKNGDAPNFGNNDGSMLENMHSQGYRDFRPSTQLYFALLEQKSVYDDVTLCEPLWWRSGTYSLKYQKKSIPLPSAEIPDNHILLLRNKKASVFMKLPDDNFRPGNDIFHIDLWVEGKPVIVDSGTFSYNAGETTQRFKSVSAHNTVQFGDHEQMPEISRFLNGKWIKMNEILSPHCNEGDCVWEGFYKDYKNNCHQRKLILTRDSLEIVDKIESPEDVKIRYHINNLQNVRFETNAQYKKEEKSISSLYYYESHDIDVITLSAQANKTKNNKTVNFKILF